MKNCLLLSLLILLLGSCSQTVDEADHTHRAVFILNGADQEQTIKELERRSLEYYNSTIVSKVNGDTLTITVGLKEGMDISRLGLTADFTFEFPTHDQKTHEIIEQARKQESQLFSNAKSLTKAHLKKEILESITDSMKVHIKWLFQEIKVNDDVFYDLKPVELYKSVEFGSWIEIVNLTNSGNNDVIELVFDKKGTQEWADISSANIGKNVHIVMDETILSSPVVQEKISNGKVWISIPSGANKNELEGLAQQLKSGRLSNKVQLESITLLNI